MKKTVYFIRIWECDTHIDLTLEIWTYYYRRLSILSRFILEAIEINIGQR